MTTVSNQASKIRCIGLVVGSRGLQGELRVKPWDSEAAWATHLKTLWLLNPNQNVQQLETLEPQKVSYASFNGRLVFLKLQGINTKTQADQLKGFSLYAYETDLPRLDDDQFYIDQLLGLSVYAQKNPEEKLGVVKQVLTTLGQEYLEVQPEVAQCPSVMVPFQKVFVTQVNLSQKRITIQGLDSMFEATISTHAGPAS